MSHEQTRNTPTHPDRLGQQRQSLLQIKRLLQIILMRLLEQILPTILTNLHLVLVTHIKIATLAKVEIRTNYAVKTTTNYRLHTALVTKITTDKRLFLNLNRNHVRQHLTEISRV